MSRMNIIDIFETMNSINDSYVEKNKDFLDIISTYSKEKKQKLYNYKIIKENRFCIFDNFSPKYYYEKLHSEILKTLLDKNTLDLKNSEFLQIFLDCINLKDKISFDNNVKVDLEYPINPKIPAEAIDIFIHDDCNALIIENKLNNAVDQKNQLARYMKHVEEDLEILNYYVIYLTLVPFKKPPINQYSRKYEKYKHLLLNCNKLIYLSAIEKDETKRSIVNFFLPKCEETIQHEIQEFEVNDELLLTKIYLTQYRILLNKLGGYTAMESTNRELAKKIFSNKEFITSSLDFVDFWNNRYEALYPIIFEEVKKDLCVFTEDENEQWFYNEINDNCLVYFECNGHFSIGFTAKEKKWTNKEHDALTKIIENYAKKKSDYFICKNEKDLKKWTWTHNLLKEDLSIAELKTIIIQSFKDLSSLVKRAI